MRCYRRNGAYPIKGIDTWLPYRLPTACTFCRNGAYPIKGIDTNCHHHHFRYHFLVEMERTRLRELTPISAFVTSPSTIEVEMERTRLRELTRYNISFFFPTNMVEMERTRLRELTLFLNLMRILSPSQ